MLKIKYKKEKLPRIRPIKKFKNGLIILKQIHFCKIAINLYYTKKSVTLKT